jgi:hypothetical protein
VTAAEELDVSDELDPVDALDPLLLSVEPDELAVGAADDDSVCL